MLKFNHIVYLITGLHPPQTLSVFNSSTYSKINLPLIITFFIILFTILDVLSKCKPQIMVTQNFSVAFQRFFLITFQTNFLLFIFWEFEPFLIFISSSFVYPFFSFFYPFLPFFTLSFVYPWMGKGPKIVFLSSWNIGITFCCR